MPESPAFDTWSRSHRSPVTIAFQKEASRFQRSPEGSPFNTWWLDATTRWAQFFRTGSGYLIRFPGLADFQVSADGLSVICWPAEGVPDGTVQHLFLNQIVPLAQSRAGNLMFHAGAVEVDGACVAFMGQSGRGKSTLTASFATAGTPFLTDDGLSVAMSGGKCMVLPSHPSIRLWNDSRQVLIADATQRADSVHYTEKARFIAGDDLVFCREPRELNRVYVLGPGIAATVQFAPIQPAAALIELVRHSFLLDVEERDALASHFDQLAALVRRPIFYRLDYPRRFECLEEVKAAIVTHACPGANTWMPGQGPA